MLQNPKNNIAFTQDLSDQFNNAFNPKMYSTPGKGGMTVIEDLNDHISEYFVETTNSKVSDVFSRAHSDQSDPRLTKLMMEFVTDANN